MKLFSCKNKECGSHTPNDAKTNKVKEAILSLHSLGVDGEPLENVDPEVEDVYFICGRCNDDVEEVPYSKVMKVKFVERDGNWLYGKYKNALRKNIYDFRINIKTGKVQIADLKPRELEVEYIQDQFKESYMGQIEVEVVDVEKDKYGNKVYELTVNNPIENRLGTVYIDLENDEIEVLGENLKDFEIKKAKQTARQSIH